MNYTVTHIDTFQVYFYDEAGRLRHVPLTDFGQHIPRVGSEIEVVYEDARQTVVKNAKVTKL